jgi:AraC-like DNA-binding protein
MQSHFVARAPCESLAHAIHELWDFQRPGMREWHAAAPKPYVELVFNLDQPFLWRASPEARAHRFGAGWITPVQDGPRFARPRGDIRLVGARLYPAIARAAFVPLPPGDGAPPRALSRRNAWFAATHRALCDGASSAERLSILECALMSRLAAVQGFAPVTNGTDSVRLLAARLGIDVRSLHRKFSRETGLSPKRFLRLTRLDGLLRDPALGDGAIRIAELAYRHGFTDQAHLAREFRLFVGRTPVQLRSGARADDTAPPHYLGIERRFLQSGRRTRR